MEKQITVISYYSPEELTGIGKYNGEMIDWLLSKGFRVVNFSTVPFYPYWSVYKGYKNQLYNKKCVNNYIDIRSWVYIPKSPGALKKIISEIVYFISLSLSFLLNLKSIRKSTLSIVILPPFFLPLLSIVFKVISKSKILCHIQDLQVDAARELKLLPKVLCDLLDKFERWQLNHVDCLSTISEGMRRKMIKKGLNDNILLMPNWSNIEFVRPTKNDFWLHKYLNLENSKKLIVYSGNIGEKQGLELILKVADKLRQREEFQFVILGEGLYKKKLQQKGRNMNLPNLTLGSLVPKEKINQMLNSSFIQLVIQKPEGADSFLPSKLTNILAAGCPTIITANKRTTLFDLMKPKNIGYVIEPENELALYNAIVEINDNDSLQHQLKYNSRKWAEENLKIDNCLSPLLDLI